MTLLAAPGCDTATVGSQSPRRWLWRGRLPFDHEASGAVGFCNAWLCNCYLDGKHRHVNPPADVGVAHRSRTFYNRALPLTTLDRLRRWNENGIIHDAQYHTLAALVRKERFSLYLELNAALYAGVLTFVFGLGWTFQTYFSNLGDPFILTTCSAIVGGCVAYCFTRGAPYSHLEVDSPSLGFDYVLYLGCLVLSAELAYIEFRFHLFRGTWDYYLLFTAAAFSLLAYRFD